jgi:hypothetical protein
MIDFFEEVGEDLQLNLEEWNEAQIMASSVFP